MYGIPSNVKQRPEADDTQAILDALRRIVRELRVSARAAEARAGLSAAQLFVLSRLAMEPRLSLGELAARTSTDPSSVSVVVSRLAEGGLLTRKRAADDERRVELAITAAGRARLRKAPAAAQDRLIGAVNGLGPGRRKRLAALLGDVVHGMGLGEKAPRLFFEEDASARRPRKRKGNG
jgi:DNA-binding MarR family transcriptional regulator